MIINCPFCGRDCKSFHYECLNNNLNTNYYCANENCALDNGGAIQRYDVDFDNLNKIICERIVVYNKYFLVLNYKESSMKIIFLEDYEMKFKINYVINLDKDNIIKSAQNIIDKIFKLKVFV